MDAPLWYLANGRKKVGPLSTQRVIKRMAAGKVPAKVLAWKEGMDAWRPVHEIYDFAVEQTVVASDPDVAAVEAPAEAPAPEAEAAEPAPAKRRKKRSGGKKRARNARSSGSDVALRPVRPAAEPDEAAEDELGDAEPRADAEQGADAAFRARYRIERKDVWRGYGLGLERRRVAIVLAGLGATALASGLIAGIGQIAGMVHVLLALPFLLAAGVVGYGLTQIGLGALSYASRQQLAGEATPSLRESFSFAFRHGPSLVLPPLLLSVAWIVPLAVLGLVSLLIKIPYLGPIGTGLLYGVHIALGAATCFLLLAAVVSAVFNPLVVAFEGGGVVSTFRLLLAFVKRATARVLLWGALPGLASLPFSALVLGLGACVLALPLGFSALMLGGDVLALGEGAIGGLSVGLVPMALWVGLFVLALVSVLASVQNALLSFLYLGGREGNDGLITRDAYLAKLEA